ncbi:hypothetical protein ES705_27496 [subsurface metagenome]
MAGACAASASSTSLRATAKPSGTSRSRAILCGRVAVLSPFRAIVPGSFQMRAALNTARSMDTASVSKRAARASRHCLTSSMLAASLGSSILTRTCPPFPLSPMATESCGTPAASRYIRTSRAVLIAPSCSASVLEIPAGRLASISIGSHRRLRISLSWVKFLGPIVMRFADRASRAGVMVFRTTYTPAACPLSFAAASASLATSSKYPATVLPPTSSARSSTMSPAWYSTVSARLISRMSCAGAVRRYPSQGCGSGRLP